MWTIGANTNKGVFGICNTGFELNEEKAKMLEGRGNRIPKIPRNLKVGQSIKLVVRKGQDGVCPICMKRAQFIFLIPVGIESLYVVAAAAGSLLNKGFFCIHSVLLQSKSCVSQFVVSCWN